MRGFTLIETMVVVALTAILMTAIASMTRFVWKTNALASEANAAVVSGRIDLSRMASQMRSASSTVSAAPDLFAFIDATGASVTESAADTTFSYFDANGSELAQPVDPQAVRVVEITRQLAQPSLTFTTSAALRNLFHP